MVHPLSDALAALRHRYGAEVVRRGDQLTPLSTWATGIPAIDQRLAPGGLPRGRLTVLAAGHGGVTGRLTLLQAMTAVASRSMDVVYVDLVETLDPGYLADLGADLGAGLIVTPGLGRWGRGLAMARALVSAGVPWVGVALSRDPPQDQGWDHALLALGDAVGKAGTVLVVAAPYPLPPALGHASSLTLACASAGWHEAHGDVVGLRVGLTVTKNRVRGASASSPQEASVLLRYPRLFATGEVVSAPTIVEATGGSPREEHSAA
jgi:hypothetical protein